MMPAAAGRGSLFGGMSMQAVRLPGGALTLSLAAALLCSGCTPLPPGDQSASASQVSTVSTSLSQVSSLRGALDRRKEEVLRQEVPQGGLTS